MSPISGGLTDLTRSRSSRRSSRSSNRSRCLKIDTVQGEFLDQQQQQPLHPRHRQTGTIHPFTPLSHHQRADRQTETMLPRNRPLLATTRIARLQNADNARPDSEHIKGFPMLITSPHPWYYTSGTQPTQLTNRYCN